MFEKQEYYTTKEVLNILKISAQTLYRWRKDGRIKFIQIGSKTIRYKKEDVDRLFNDGIS